MMAIALSQTATGIVIEVVVGIAMAFLYPLLVDFLRRKTQEALANSRRADIDSKKMLAERAKAFLFGTAASIAERQFPLLAKQILAHKMNAAEIRQVLYNWGDSLRVQALDHFEHQGIDLVREFSEITLSNWITRAADATTPCPGASTSESLADERIARAMVEHGMEYVRENFFNLTSTAEGT